MKYNKNFYQIKSNSDIFDRIKAERDSIGYYNLTYQDTTEIKKYAKSIAKKYIIVLGIGGSSLGARAIYEFLLPSNNYDKELLFLDTIDPLKINYGLKRLDLNDAQFVVISKSGSTIETSLNNELSLCLGLIYSSNPNEYKEVLNLHDIKVITDLPKGDLGSSCLLSYQNLNIGRGVELSKIIKHYLNEIDKNYFLQKLQ